MKRKKVFVFVLLMLPNIVLGSVLMKVISCTCSAVSAGIGGVLGGLAGAVSLSKYEDVIEKGNVEGNFHFSDEEMKKREKQFFAVSYEGIIEERFLEGNFQPSDEEMKKRGKKFVALSFALGAVLAGRAGYRTPHLLHQALRAAITRKKTITP
jgi:hypothetical protein